MPKDFSTEEVTKVLEEEKKMNGPDFNMDDSESLESRTEKEKARSAITSLINDVNAQREDIDKLNQSVEYIAGTMTKIAQAVDNQSAIINELQKGGGTPDANKAMLGELLQSPLGEKLLSRIFPESNPGPAPLIDQSIINQKMTQAFMDDLDTGESIRKFISDSLKKKATRQIVNHSLGNIGNDMGDVSHGPQ